MGEEGGRMERSGALLKSCVGKREWRGVMEEES